MSNRQKKLRFILIFSAFMVFSIFTIFSISCKNTEQSQEISAGHSEHLQPAQESQPASKKEPDKKTLYQCPMHPNYTSDKPGRCPICGMDLVPVEEEHQEMQMEMPAGSVMISPEKQQKLGVTFGEVKIRKLEKTLRTVANFSYDETRLADINTKFSGWIEKLDVNFVGQLVKKGQPLFSIYSPELVSAQEEYLLALKAKSYFEDKTYSEGTGNPATLLETARRRLTNWDVTAAQIEELEKSRKSLKTMVFYAPFTGFVVEKNILQGKFVTPGENLYKLADISTVWVLADIYESDLPLISPGEQAAIELPYFPGEQFRGRISYVYPYLENETRTVKVRLELSNKDFRLKPNMYGTVSIQLNLGERLALPVSAVLDSGIRKIVFIDKGEGHFEPREVRLGSRTDDYYEVFEGVGEGERVVTSANFLIDSESKLKAAIKAPHKH